MDPRLHVDEIRRRFLSGESAILSVGMDKSYLVKDEPEDESGTASGYETLSNLSADDLVKVNGFKLFSFLL